MNLALSNEFSKEYIAPVKSLSSHFLLTKLVVETVSFSKYKSDNP